MVKIQGKIEDEYERLDLLVQDVAKAHDVDVDITGWTRKTYDLYRVEPRTEVKRLLVRVESFATTNGEVRVLEDDGMSLAQALAERIEQEFDVGEAVIVRA